MNQPHIPYWGDKNIRSAPFERCVFCGNDGDGNPLTDEHVIPIAIGGRLILSHATCLKCRDITGGFESQCLNGVFAAVRAHQGFKVSRARPRSNRRRLPVNVLRADGTDETIQLPLPDHPGLLMLPEFAPPILLMPTPVEDRIFWPKKLKRWGLGDEFQGKIAKIAKATSAKDIRIPYKHAWQSFGRMLAKIGHCAAVAKLGVDGFRPMLQKMILENDQPLARLVGCANVQKFERLPPAPSRNLTMGHQYMLHDYAHRDFENPLLLCFIRLWASIPDSPTYAVVIGEGDTTLRERLLDLSFLKHT